MISVAEAISDLLFVRDTVVVPGLGAFVKKPVPAKVNPVANHFAMPSSSIEFDSNLREDNELVVNYLSEKSAIAKDEAKKLLAMFVSDCFNQLKSSKKLVLKNIGTLYYNGADGLVFEQEENINYNSDAFGLCDFSLEPVLREKTKEEIKVEIEKRQKDKNTLVTVDEKAVHEKDERPNRHAFWLWILFGFLLLAGVIYGLREFDIIRFSWEKVPHRKMGEPKVYTMPFYEWKCEWKEPVPEANIRIVAGCFGQEEAAARLTNSLKDNGFSSAFYELRGNKWFVSFGRYYTEEEATSALREIRANTAYKAWILK